MKEKIKEKIEELIKKYEKFLNGLRWEDNRYGLVDKFVKDLKEAIKE